jgi:hypothetical protein
LRVPPRQSASEDGVAPTSDRVVTRARTLLAVTFRMLVALILTVLFAALIGASILAAKYNDTSEHPPENAKADDRVPEDRIAKPFAH